MSSRAPRSLESPDLPAPPEIRPEFHALEPDADPGCGPEPATQRVLREPAVEDLPRQVLLLAGLAQGDVQADAEDQARVREIDPR